MNTKIANFPDHPKPIRRDLMGLSSQDPIPLAEAVPSTGIDYLNSGARGRNIEVKYSGYTKAGSGKPESKNEDLVYAGSLQTQAGAKIFVGMCLDGLTGVMQGEQANSLLEKTGDVSGGRLAANAIKETLLKQLALQPVIDEATVRQSILNANAELDMLNRQFGLHNPAHKFSTMLSLAVVTEDGTVILAQLGDSQIYVPQDDLLWKGDQDEIGIIQQWIVQESPNPDKWQFFARQRELINNGNIEFVAAEMRKLLADYSYPYLDKLTHETLVYSALNGDQQASHFLKLQTIPPSIGPKRIVLFTDGIADGLADFEFFDASLKQYNSLSVVQTIGNQIISQIQENKNTGLKRWGDDEGLLVIDVGL